MARKSLPKGVNRIFVACVPLAICLSIIAISLQLRIFPGSTTSSKMSCCGPSCREAQKTEEHYDKDYFEWQTKLGKQKAEQKDWDAFLQTKPNFTVGDLGAGGGHVLASLNITRKIAIEVSEVARKGIRKVYPGQIEMYQFPELVPDNSIDVLLSTSAIEHFECPLTELREMSKKVKVGGTIIVGIKNEGIVFLRPPRSNDIDQHLYTWSHQQLYNLITTAGFKVTSFDPDFATTERVHAKKVRESGKFNSEGDKLYIWIRGVKQAAK